MNNLEKESDNLLDSTLAEPKTSMLPSFTFSQCRPISKHSDIEDCLTNPPEWVNRVIPLKKRSGYVIRNAVSDCHMSEDRFYARPRLDRRTVPKTLVCHDYKGGYLSDSYIPFEGAEDNTLATDGYTFYNWSQIDYFVYFSHHFLTIPPLAWVNAGHKNGVKVLGTIITENSDGVQICNEQIFKTLDQMREFVYQLTEIQKTFGFDGWLLNIENPVNNAYILKEFVALLTQQTHRHDSESVVIWYDSVTKDGLLRWQDQLNDQNRCFFDSCDGIFLNYGWNEEKLINTVAMAGTRRFDVFVGVDVFGRGVFGGGQFNTYKAVELISKHNLSMAIFAPGWTHETMAKVSSESTFRKFLNRDDAFWASLWPFLYTHPVNDFFETDFHVGLDSNYYNLYIQKQQTTNLLNPENPNAISDYSIVQKNTGKCLSRGFFDAKNICIISNDNLEKPSSTFVHNLFACDIKLNGKIGVYFMTKKAHIGDKAVLNVTLLTCLRSGAMKEIKLLSEQRLLATENLGILEVYLLRDEDVKYNYTLNYIARKRMKILNKPEISGSIVLSMFEFLTTPCDLLEIGATVRNGSSISLLEFGIIQLF
ncbi:unnamed protein product [Ceutorhynchus assimilis]|uniref:Cytosolic endo-beta-N-acetylglucosaminidase TIM barrel domain-containing protein n=1 Tax=Ceutorhynchus assimilis TaxID=467358 RepID=A0A9N9QNR8_9CUCU|nr:unnamed protein product [Ceutorhynchus assimilis]